MLWCRGSRSTPDVLVSWLLRLARRHHTRINTETSTVFGFVRYCFVLQATSIMANHHHVSHEFVHWSEFALSALHAELLECRTHISTVQGNFVARNKRTRLEIVANVDIRRPVGPIRRRLERRRKEFIAILFFFLSALTVASSACQGSPASASQKSSGNERVRARGQISGDKVKQVPKSAAQRRSAHTG